MNEPNMAVMQNNIEHLTLAVHELHDTVRLQEVNVNTLLRTAQVMQSNHESLSEKFDNDLAPKVKELWENRSQFKGGYIVISILCSLLVGAATIAGVLLTLHQVK